MSVRNAGEYIKWLRCKENLTQEQLAFRICSTVALSQIENNKTVTCAGRCVCLLDVGIYFTSVKGILSPIPLVFTIFPLSYTKTASTSGRLSM